MAKIQDIDIPHLEFAEAAAPGTPASGIVRIYAKTDGLLYSKDDAGAETALGGGAGSTFVGCSIYHNTTEAPASNDPLAFNTELYDTGLHDPVTNNTRITITADGKYDFQFGTTLSAHAAGTNLCRLRKNGTDVASLNWYADTASYVQGQKTLALVATDYVEVIRSGTATAGHASAFEAQTQLTVTKVG